MINKTADNDNNRECWMFDNGKQTSVMAIYGWGLRKVSDGLYRRSKDESSSKQPNWLITPATNDHLTRFDLFQAISNTESLLVDCF